MELAALGLVAGIKPLCVLLDLCLPCPVLSCVAEAGSDLFQGNIQVLYKSRTGQWPWRGR